MVLKALEKEPARRYETVAGLARDIERFLAGDVVEARPPSQLYRIKKFVQRHRSLVIVAGLLTLSLLAGIFGTAWGMFEARREANEKEQARLNEREERQYAEAIAEGSTPAERRQALSDSFWALLNSTEFAFNH